MVRLISLQDCPATFGTDLTRAANTQNKIEKRDFAALDEQQGRLRTDLLLSLQKEYVYRTGDKPPLPESGCTLDEATIALACAQVDVSFAMTAKREVSRLYEDIKQAPYTALFNTSTTPLRLWRSVEVMRKVDIILKQSQSLLEGKSRLIAIHGNRFVLYLTFRQLGSAILDESKSDVSSDMSKLQVTTGNTLAKVIDKAAQMYPGAYPSNLFKNVTKCKALAAAIETDGW
jgi:hypothetical protein